MQTVQTALRLTLTGRCCSVQPCGGFFFESLKKDLCELLIKMCALAEGGQQEWGPCTHTSFSLLTLRVATQSPCRVM